MLIFTPCHRTAVFLARIVIPRSRLLVGAERPGLPQHLIHQSGLAVVDVGDDGEIADHSDTSSV
jgi:hypothetical protein